LRREERERDAHARDEGDEGVAAVEALDRRKAVLEVVTPRTVRIKRVSSLGIGAG